MMLKSILYIWCNGMYIEHMAPICIAYMFYGDGHKPYTTFPTKRRQTKVNTVSWVINLIYWVTRPVSRHDKDA